MAHDLTAMLGLLLLMGSASIHPAPTQELQQVLAPTGTLPAQYFGYVMSQVSSTILVVDTSTNEIVNKLKHADMVKPAGGRFHPILQRYYAGGTGKITIWDTTDVANPVYLKTVIPGAQQYRRISGLPRLSREHDGVRRECLDSEYSGQQGLRLSRGRPRGR